jgi:hypothetical protein
VIVPGHHDRGLLAARQVPEPRERRSVHVHLRDQVREQALLLVRLRDRDLVDVEPVGLEEVVGPDRPGALEVFTDLIRIALPRVHDRAREVVGERGGLAAARADAT